MLRFLLFVSLFSFGCILKSPEKSSKSTRPEWALALHGGAGAISKSEMTPEKETAYRAALDSALTVGETILKNGGSALDAVEKTIRSLEDCPLFNAGKGAVFTHEGKNELDASIMEGQSRRAGAVGSVTVVRNPISLARAVMEKSEHVFLIGQGAETFAREHGLETVEPSYFFTQARWDALQKRLEEAKKTKKTGFLDRLPLDEQRLRFGTVGCVALDRNGHLAAGTSTGGMTDKRWNRLGDAPVIGAGTWADDRTAAVSCTGWGEFFIRAGVAHDLADRMLYAKEDLKTASEAALKAAFDLGGDGGLIAIDRNGDISMPFNSGGMYRGWARPDGRGTAIHER